MEVIYQHEEKSFIPFPTTEKWFKKTRHSQFQKSTSRCLEIGWSALSSDCRRLPNIFRNLSAKFSKVFSKIIEIPKMTGSQCLIHLDVWALNTTYKQSNLLLRPLSANAHIGRTSWQPQDWIATALSSESPVTNVVHF